MLSANISLQGMDGPLLFLAAREQLLLVVLQKLNLLQQTGQHALILIVLNLPLVLFDLVLILFQGSLNFEHMLFV